MSKQGLRRRIVGRLFSFYVLAFPVLLSFILGGAPAALFAQSSAPVDLEGTVEVLHEDRDVGSRYIYFLRTATERLQLQFAADAPALTTGDHIRARGRRINGTLALDSSSSVQTVAAALSNTFGGQKTILILVNFYDNATQPQTVSTAQSVMMASSNFEQENSFSQTWLTGAVDPAQAADVYGWFTINQSYTACDYSTTAKLAEQAATAAGANLSQYNRRVYAFPKNSCTWSGLGTVGGNPSQAWFNGNVSQPGVSHEIGHNLGLYHSHALDCGTTVLGSNCTAQEYGDMSDVMGSRAAHYNSFQKERLGWLNYNVSPPITTVQADGIFWIASYASNDPNPKALKILKTTNPSTGKNTYYYVEYRQPIGFDSVLSPWFTGLTDGVQVRIGTESDGNSSYLLDMTPSSSSSDFNDAALAVGQSFSDPNAGVTLTVLSANSTGASISVTFGGGGGGSTCTRSNPTVSLSPSSQSTTVGNSVSYTMTVKNNDSSGCTTSGFNLGASLPSGLAASFGSSSLSIAPGSNASTNLMVSSSSSLSSGTYSFTAAGTNSTTSSYSGSALGVDTLMAPTSISVTVSTDKSSYSRNQSVTITATVSSSGSPVSGASVTFTITKPNGSVVSGSATTGSNGTAIYKYRVKAKDPFGTYQVNAAANMSGVSASATTSFTVQ